MYACLAVMVGWGKLCEPGYLPLFIDSAVVWGSGTGDGRDDSYVAVEAERGGMFEQTLP